MCVGLLVLAALYEASDPQFRPVLGLIAPLPFAFLVAIVRSGLLAGMGLIFLRQPPIGDERPPIDVIIPAYNEAAVIVDTLKSIDAAAAHYGGPVRIIMTNDGSTDQTRALAESTIDAFVAATGRVIEGQHKGKSAALNLALAETTSDIVVRIDADTLIGGGVPDSPPEVVPRSRRSAWSRHSCGRVGNHPRTTGCACSKSFGLRAQSPDAAERRRGQRRAGRVRRVPAGTGRRARWLHGGDERRGR